jgi:HNH endonuclease
MRTCTKDNCDRPHRARGLCGSHYNAEHQPNRHEPKPVHCAWCGTEVMKTPGGTKARRPVCSIECRTHLARKDAIASRPHSTALVGPVKPTRNPMPSPTPRPSRLFAAGRCGWCGDHYTIEIRGRSSLHSYCSTRCARKRYKSNRNEGSYWITKRERLAIYERDGWTCQLCMTQVDKSLHHSDNWSASLDHIVPRSQQVVPDHSPANLRLTHRWCNSMRGDNTYVSDEVFLALA